MGLKSIRGKIMASILCITFVTVLGVSALFYQKSAQLVEDNYSTVLGQRMRLLTDSVDEMLEEVCYVGISASCDDDLEQMLSDYLVGGDVANLEELSQVLRVYKNRQDAISAIYLLIPETGQVVTTMDYPVYRGGFTEEEITDYVAEAESGANPAILTDLIHEDQKVVSFMETVEDANGEVLGYLFTDLTENIFYYNYFDDADDADFSDFMLLLHGTQLITSRENNRMGEDFPGTDAQSAYVSEGDVTASDGEYLYLYCEGDFSGCGIFVQVERGVILSDVSKMRFYIIGAAAIFLAAAVLLALYMARQISNPVSRLVGVMQRVSDGEMDSRVETFSHDEIGMMSAEFNRMLDQIEELIRQVILEDEKKKDAELEALQYQITPHFMYNTLNSIKCSALIHGENETAQVIGEFAELLQNCISKKGAFLTIAEEIQILEQYVHLQKFRSGGEYDILYDVEPEVQQCLIPRLILQPLVENAILHGIDVKQRKGRLIVRAYALEERLYLEVEDNGRGLTEEQITELLTSKAKKTRGLTAVGIPNVRDRLKLYYKEEAGISYRSREGETVAVIYMPIIKGEEL